MPDFRLINATLVLPDRLIDGAALDVRGERIVAVGELSRLPQWDGPTTDVGSLFLTPGFVDLHVHGGGGADFMDGSADAFRTAIAAHTRHGTTTFLPTSTCARHEQTLAFLENCRAMKLAGADPMRGIGRVAGAHLYGPYFAEEKVGCHPRETRPPSRSEYEQYLHFADAIVTATCAPELPGAADFYRAASALGVRLNAGHSNASWDEMDAAHCLGVRHVDHLFCAMSNYVSVRPRFGNPMRGGMMEYVLATDSITTEIIADGRHLAPELLRFAIRMKGADRVALVTDCSRALGQPAGEYIFGPLDGGEPFYHDGEVGLTPDRTGLASGARGMDHAIRHVVHATGIDLPTAVKMATLTPARIAGLEAGVGSLTVGKLADLVLLDAELRVKRLWIDGIEAKSSQPHTG